MVRIDLLVNNWNYSLVSIMRAEYEMNKARLEQIRASTKGRKKKLRKESVQATKQKLKNFFSFKRTRKDEKQDTISMENEISLPDVIIIAH